MRRAPNPTAALPASFTAVNVPPHMDENPRLAGAGVFKGQTEEGNRIVALAVGSANASRTAALGALSSFNFNGSALRTVTGADGQPWFVAADVCAALDVQNVTQAVSRLDQDERAMFNIGRQGAAAAVNESGLYALIMRSRKPEARRFRRWVTSEVLPSIRKTGAYRDPAADLNDPAALRSILLGYSEQVIALRATVQDQTPKVEYADALLASQGTQLVRNVAKTLGVPVMALWKALREKRVILGDGTPAAQYVQRGYFESQPFVVTTKTRGEVVRYTPMVTPRGVEFIRRFVARHHQAVCGTSKGGQMQEPLL